MSHDLTTALALHQSGCLEDAARLYQAILEHQPLHADALHLFGLLHHEQGRHMAALEFIERAVTLRPNAAAYHANLGEVYRALGQFERAAGCCRTALGLRPDYPEAYCNLALCLQGLLRLDESVEQFRHALRLRPDFATAHNNLGAVLRELGRRDEAVDHFRRAVELAPGSALAQSNLGQLLLDCGRAEEALPCCREAIRLQPDLAPLHHNLGNVLQALDRPDEAKAAYEEALRLDTSLSRTHAALGRMLAQQGQLDDALLFLRNAVELEPDNTGFWSALGDLYMERNESAEAIPCFKKAIICEPDRVDTHLSLGLALQMEARLAEAGDNFLTALRLRPESAQAHLNLGGLREELGEMTEAEECFRVALRLQPALPLPHARLATLLRDKLPEADRAALEARLADAQLGTEGRSNLLFGLAHVLDACGEYARAADCLRQANALVLEQAISRHRIYDPIEHEKFVEGLLSGCDAAFFKRLAGAGLDTRRPVFVFGLPRSGTTLIEQVLASHSRIHGAGELRLTWQSFSAMPAVLGRNERPLVCLPYLDGTACRQLAERHMECLHRYDEGKSECIVDKMPDNYMYLGLLAVLFPNAVFIHCRRDLRDVAVSCWMTHFRTIRWANDPDHIRTRFGQYCRLMDHWRAVLPVAIHEVDYEETVTDLEAVARRLVRACSVEWEPACLEFHRTRRPIRTASVTQVRQPIYTRSVARWKHYEEALGSLFADLPRRNSSRVVE